MLNIMLTGIGGQGTVLAAKLLAQAAQNKGWAVRAAETIGMAQRGGSVISHVRMGNLGEEVHAPLLNLGTADLIIAFEPGEAARCLPYLAKDGLMVTASSAVQPITAALSADAYTADAVVEGIRRSLGQFDEWNDAPGELLVVDEGALLQQVGNRKALNTVLLASALALGRIPLTVDDLRDAIRVAVKPQFMEVNLKAVDIAETAAKAR